MPDDATTWALRGGLGRETPVNFTVAGGVVLQALQKRIAIVVYPPATDDILLSFRGVADLATGLRVKAGGLPVVMRIEDYGPLVTQQLFGRTTGAAPQTVSIVEVGNQN